MTRKDAQMIAEELYKLMQKNGNVEEEWLNRREAAKYLGVTMSYMNRKSDEIPHVKTGRSYKYAKSKLNAYLNR